MADHQSKIGKSGNANYREQSVAFPSDGWDPPEKKKWRCKTPCLNNTCYESIQKIR